MEHERTTSRKGRPSTASTTRPDSAKVDLDRVEVITAEDVDYAEEMIARTLREMADKIAAESKKGKRKG